MSYEYDEWVGSASNVSHRRWSRLTVAAVLLSGACGSGSEFGSQAAEAHVAECPPHQLEGSVTCHSVSVLENPDEPGGRVLALEVMVLQTRAAPEVARSMDPVFVIPGGPGQSATRANGPRSYFGSVFDRLREGRDIVLLAPRGTAGSGELALEPSDERLFDELSTVIPPSWARAARDRLMSSADLASYTTAHIVEDLEAIRDALGYGRVNLYGTSYGTRVAQLYASRYPDRVRTLILKAPVPPDAITPLTYTSGTQRALDLIFDLCEEQPDCARTYPDAKSRFDDLMVGLRDEPISLSVVHPFSQDRVDVQVDDAVFGYMLRNVMMAASGAATALSLVDQVSRGETSTLSTVIPALRAGYATQLAGGMTLSVVGTEDAPRVTPSLLEEDAAAGFLRGAVARGFQEAVAEWPVGEAPTDSFTFLTGPIPTLLVAGTYDPATPPEFAHRIAQHLDHALVVEFRGGAHSANNFTGLDGIMTQFVQNGSLEGLDLSAAEANRPLPLVR